MQFDWMTKILAKIRSSDSYKDKQKNKTITEEDLLDLEDRFQTAIKELITGYFENSLSKRHAQNAKVLKGAWKMVSNEIEKFGMG